MKKDRPALINRILFTVYMLLPTVAFVYGFVTENVLLLAVIMIVSALAWFIVSGPLLGFISRIRVRGADGSVLGASRGPAGEGVPGGHHGTDSAPLKVFIASALACLVILLLWLWAYFPGSYFKDSIEQYEQAMTGHYDDWHPVWHTLLFFTIPLKITGGAVWSVVFWQMLVFSLVIGYMTAWIYGSAGRLPALISWGYIVLNPYTGLVLLYPLKDIAFALAGAVSMIMAAKILLTDGEWAGKWWRLAAFGFVIASAGIFRHNGIIFAGFLVLALIFVLKFRKWIQVAVWFALFMFLIKGPVYSLLQVESNPQTVVQAVGLPMAIIGNVTVQTPEKLDAETAEFVYAIAPQEEWEASYELGNFGIMKYWRGLDLDIIEETGVMPIVKMSLRCIAASPGPSFKAILELTDIVYGWDILDQGFIGPQIVENDDGLVTAWHEPLASVLMICYKLVRLHGYNFTRQSAFALVIMLSVMLACFDLRKPDDWKKIVVCLPVFAYDFGTMLLLTSADARFFYVTYLVCPVVVVTSLMLKSKQ
ncbi:MAG: hypothetical protein K6F54_00645 [Lachnospiraceae bacterium]|nr:hypothetical protein [Lachnospiraceae bacterium]